MVEIILGMVTFGTVTCVLLTKAARKHVKKRKEGSLGPVWVGLIIGYTVFLGLVGGAAGLGVSVISPVPPLLVEEKMVTTLVPFPKEETGPVIYGVRDYLTGTIQVRYRDNNGTLQSALCCDQTTPKVTEVDGNPSVKEYSSPSYLSWFSIRFSSTWYELHVPADSVIGPPEHIHIPR